MTTPSFAHGDGFRGIAGQGGAGARPASVRSRPSHPSPAVASEICRPRRRCRAVLPLHDDGERSSGNGAIQGSDFAAFRPRVALCTPRRGGAWSRSASSAASGALSVRRWRSPANSPPPQAARRMRNALPAMLPPLPRRSIESDEHIKMSEFSYCYR